MSFPSDMYLALEKLALQKKVSVAWIVRDAVERYVAESIPIAASRRTKTAKEKQ